LTFVVQVALPEPFRQARFFDQHDKKVQDGEHQGREGEGGSRPQQQGEADQVCYRPQRHRIAYIPKRADGNKILGPEELWSPRTGQTGREQKYSAGKHQRDAGGQQEGAWYHAPGRQFHAERGVEGSQPQGQTARQTTDTNYAHEVSDRANDG